MFVQSIRPTDEELFQRYNPELQRRSIEEGPRRAQEFVDYTNKLKEWSKSDKSSMYLYLWIGDVAGKVRLTWWYSLDSSKGTSSSPRSAGQGSGCNWGQKENVTERGDEEGIGWGELVLLLDWIGLGWYFHHCLLVWLSGRWDLCLYCATYAV